MEDLLPHLELPQCHCLNASSAHPLRNCLATEARDDAALVLQSDCDEELLLSLRFMTNCRVSAITVEAPAEGAPTGLSLFVNKIGLDFDSAKTDTPTQVIELKPEDFTVGAGKPQQLRYVLFQNVSELTIFIPGNLGGGEETRLTKLTLHGTPILMEGTKRSKAEQEASSKGDWLGKGIA